MNTKCPLTRKDKLRSIFAAKEAVSFITNGNGGDLIVELGREWREKSKTILELRERERVTGHDYAARVYVEQEKRDTIRRLMDELKIKFPLSLIKAMAYTPELCTYDMFKRALYAHIDMNKGQSRAKSLAAFKESIASDFHYYGFPKWESEQNAMLISEAIFGDTKGVNYPRKSKTYTSKYIQDHIIK